MSLMGIFHRLKYDASYTDRYSSLSHAVEAQTKTRWSSATSAHLVWMDVSAGEVLRRLVTGSTVYRNGEDMIAVVDFDDRQNPALLGVPDPDLLRFVLRLPSGAIMKRANTLMAVR